MPIVGFSFSKISAEKFQQAKEKIKINVRVDVKDITKEELKIGEKETVKISFVFSVDYDPRVGELLLEGNVFFAENPKKIRKIIESWKEKKVEEEIRVDVFNFIITRCNVKALQLEEELGLPIHLPMPRIKKE